MISIDLGSNSLRVAKFNCEMQNNEHFFTTVTKIADGLAQTGKINDAAIKRTIDALKHAQSIIEFDEEIYAVTTEAVRKASNSDEVIAKIKAATGVEFTIISGDDEAKYTLLAVESRVDILYPNAKDSFVLVDIGGGSTELIFNYRDKVFSQSFPIGIVTISQKYDANISLIEQKLPQLMQEMQEFCDTIYQAHGKVAKFVATAGTPTTIAALKQNLTYKTYDPDIVEGTLLVKKELDYYLERLMKMSQEHRIESVGSGREEIITTGVAIYKELFKIVGIKKSVVIDFGLVEGVAIHHCKEKEK
ncbi:MAG: phosphatase [Campylobacterales bacterium]|nr:phosphatase [Campylobacterales bacterium]